MISPVPPYGRIFEFLKRIGKGDTQQVEQGPSPEGRGVTPMPGLADFIRQRVQTLKESIAPEYERYRKEAEDVKAALKEIPYRREEHPLKLPTQISAGAVAGILASLLGAHDDDVESGMQAFLSTVKAVNEEEAKRLENEWERLKLEYETKLKAESLEADLARQEYELAEKIAIPALSMQTEAAQRMYDEIWKAETPEAFDVALARARQSNVFGILGIPEPEPSVVESYRKAIQSKNLVKLADNMASMLQQARIAAERGAPETVALVFRHFAEAAGLPTEELARVRNEFQDIYDSAVVNNLLAQIGGITKYLWKLPELLKRDIEQGSEVIVKAPVSAVSRILTEARKSIAQMVNFYYKPGEEERAERTRKALEGYAMANVIESVVQEGLLTPAAARILLNITQFEERMRMTEQALALRKRGLDAEIAYRKSLLAMREKEFDSKRFADYARAYSDINRVYTSLLRAWIDLQEKEVSDKEKERISDELETIGLIRDSLRESLMYLQGIALSSGYTFVEGEEGGVSLKGLGRAVEGVEPGRSYQIPSESDLKSAEKATAQSQQAQKTQQQAPSGKPQQQVPSKKPPPKSVTPPQSQKISISKEAEAAMGLSQALIQAILGKGKKQSKPQGRR